MNTAATKNFKSLLRKLGKGAAPEVPAAADPVEELVLSFLLWESTTDKATTALGRIHQNIVDFNDLRVSMPHETVEFIGERYPLASERAQRLRATLRDIYLREHCVSLERLSSMGKREIKKYMESLEGIVPYVSTRVMLRSFDTHGIPVDEQLMRLLVAEKIADTDTEIAALSTWLARQVKAGEGIDAHDRLQAWSDAAAARPARKAKTKAKSTRAKTKTKTKRKTTKKTTAKKAATTRSKAKTTSKKKKKKSVSRS